MVLTSSDWTKVIPSLSLSITVSHAFWKMLKMPLPEVFKIQLEIPNIEIQLKSYFFYCLKNVFIWFISIGFTVKFFIYCSEVVHPAEAANSLAQVFSCEFWNISKNTFFTEHVWATASDPISLFEYSFGLSSNRWVSKFLTKFLIWIFELPICHCNELNLSFREIVDSRGQRLWYLYYTYV